MCLRPVTPAAALHYPVVAAIAFAVLSESRHLVLVAERTPHPVRVQIRPRLEMSEPNLLPAFDRRPSLAERLVRPVSYLPETLGAFAVRHGSDELLPTATLKLPLVAVELELSPAFDVREFHCRAAPDVVLVIGRHARGSQEEGGGNAADRGGLHGRFSEWNSMGPVWPGAAGVENRRGEHSFVENPVPNSNAVCVAA